MTILSVGETNFGFLKIEVGVNAVISADRTRGDALLLGHPLCEESLCAEPHLTVVVTQWDRSLRRVVEGLDVHGRVGGGGGGRHGRWWWSWRESSRSLQSDLEQLDG